MVTQCKTLRSYFLLFALYTHIIVCYRCYYDVAFLIKHRLYPHRFFFSVKFIGYAEPQVFFRVKYVTLIILHTKRILTSKFHRAENCKY